MVLRCTILAACLLSPGCRRHPRVDSAGFTEPDAPQQMRALAAVMLLKLEFNSGNCELVYNEAGSHFRLQDPKEWRRECAEMKANWGEWKKFEVKFAQKWSDRGPLVCILGLAEFEKETRQLGFVWTLENNNVHLFSLMMRTHDDQGWIEIPRPNRGNGSPLIDPPSPKLSDRVVSL